MNRFKRLILNLEKEETTSKKVASAALNMYDSDLDEAYVERLRNKYGEYLNNIKVPGMIKVSVGPGRSRWVSKSTPRGY